MHGPLISSMKDNYILIYGMFYVIQFRCTQHKTSELKITGSQETFQSIFSWTGWKYSEKSPLHIEDRSLF